MRHGHERVIGAAAGRRPASRRRFLVGSAKLAGGGTLALAMAGGAFGRGRRSALAQSVVDVSTPVGVLNYALTLEHLEATFYRDGLDGFAAGDFDDGVFDNLAVIRDHEIEHVDTLTAVIGDLGGEAVAELEYDFGDAFGDSAAFLETAALLENTGVYAYTGAAQYLIEEDALLTAALTIHGVEARHASYLNRLTGASPFPDAVDQALAPDDVFAAASGFIVTGGVASGGSTASGGTTNSSASATGTGGTAATTMPNTGTGDGLAVNGDGSGNLGMLGLAATGAAAVGLIARRSKLLAEERRIQ